MISDLELSPRGDQFAVSSHNGEIYRFTLDASGSKQYGLPFREKRGVSQRTIAYSPDGRLLASLFMAGGC